MAKPQPLDYQSGPSERRVDVVPWVLLAAAAAVCLTVAALLEASRTHRPDRRILARHFAYRLQACLDAFAADVGRYPTQAEGLNALMTRPAGLATWKGPYLPSRVVDPWGRPFLYRAPAAGGFKAPCVFSTGPDGVPGNADDILSR